MKCPEGHETRPEYNSDFCPVCLKHYDRCSAQRHMERCGKLKDHKGDHQGRTIHGRPGSTWSDGAPGSSR